MARRSTCAISGRRRRRSTARSPATSIPGCSSTSYSSVFQGDEHWNSIEVPQGQIYRWEPASTYVRNPPYFDGMGMTPPAVADIRSARVLALLGDSVTTDHISPAGNIAKASPAAKYLVAAGRAARGLQLLRRASRQPRGDDARHLREHPPAQPARPRHGRRRHGAHAQWRADEHLRCGDALQGRGHAAGRHRGQGVRHRLLARLGRERARCCSA